MSKPETYLVYHINEHLCVFHCEAMDLFVYVLFRKDSLNQGGEFVHSECASNQAFVGYDVELKGNRGGGISILRIDEGMTGDIPLLSTFMTS